ncbi:AraC family transcriptional regulator [Pseudomonas nitroreducens]|uniref:AraC family transcriptional regulator n=1 Tax=Pseudomonas nitroreducens TaxID=46680 RepID=UPI0014746EC6|nr:AraC family transcriptional regulator [Pseudomonas nitroreducens]MDG9852349.1 AraC family transcriptional regulator [Pseudomonas nitroreducens]MDH1071452.1 AraC family transcriptional regulator [Pseudomonas nitroreducens]NMZ76351.1 AraC family transcriptional regulator [Pseudomonas nitroreducens]NNN23315.1 helix-turn-helix domain-containing protein [Pseudomonas nitroreducens]
MSPLLFASSAFASTILLHAARLGLSAVDLRLRAGIAEALLEDHRGRIPALQVEQLWRECERASGNPHFGCELVNGMATHCLQGLNILLDSAPDLGTSLRAFCEHVASVTNCVDARLEFDGENTRLVLDPVTQDLHHFGLDAAVLTLIRNISRRIGRSPQGVFNAVGIGPRQRCEEMLTLWNVPWQVTPTPFLQLPTALLDTPLPGANEFLYQSLRRQWCGTAQTGEGDGLSLARIWLRSSDQPIERIAERIGYRQSGNFIRAFRKRFGITPKQFRLGQSIGA